MSDRAFQHVGINVLVASNGPDVVDSSREFRRAGIHIILEADRRLYPQKIAQKEPKQRRTRNPMYVVFTNAETSCRKNCRNRKKKLSRRDLFVAAGECKVFGIVG